MTNKVARQNNENNDMTQGPSKPNRAYVLVPEGSHTRPALSATTTSRPSTPTRSLTHRSRPFTPATSPPTSSTSCTPVDSVESEAVESTYSDNSHRRILTHEEMSAIFSSQQSGSQSGKYLSTIVTDDNLWTKYDKSCKFQTRHIKRSEYSREFAPNTQCEDLFNDILQNVYIPASVSLRLQNT